jgi:hypothetical protein
LAALDEGSVARLRARVKEQLKHPPRRSEKFPSALLEAPDRAATESRLVRTEIAGFPLTINERLRDPAMRASRGLRIGSEEREEF